jgi:hypothetical protein
MDSQSGVGQDDNRSGLKVGCDLGHAGFQNLLYVFRSLVFDPKKDNGGEASPREG